MVKELLTISGWQIPQIDDALHTPTSSSECRQERLQSRKSPSPWSMAQLAIQKKLEAEK